MSQDVSRVQAKSERRLCLTRSLARSDQRDYVSREGQLSPLLRKTRGWKRGQVALRNWGDGMGGQRVGLGARKFVWWG